MWTNYYFQGKRCYLIPLDVWSIMDEEVDYHGFIMGRGRLINLEGLQPRWDFRGQGWESQAEAMEWLRAHATLGPPPPRRTYAEICAANIDGWQ